MLLLLGLNMVFSSLHNILLQGNEANGETGGEGRQNIGRRRLDFDKNLLPHLQETDSIEIYHLRSFYTQLVKVPESKTSFGMSTSGMALRSTSTGAVMVLEYKPFTFEASFLPILNMNESLSSSSSMERLASHGTRNLKEEEESTGPNYRGGHKSNRDKDKAAREKEQQQQKQQQENEENGIYWDKRAVLEYMTELDQSRWQHSTFLGHINGIVYSYYVDWLEEYLSSKERIFVPQSICSSPSESTDHQDLSCFETADTWENFITQSLETFSRLSVELHAMLPPRASEIQVMSNIEPIHVTMVSDEGSSSSSSKKEEEVSESEREEEEEATRLRGSEGRRKGRALQGSGEDGSGRGDNADNPSDFDQDKPANSTATTPSNPHIIAGGGGEEQDPSSAEGSSEEDKEWAENDTGGTAIQVTRSEMATYYRELINCMNGYASEEYTSALRSCMTGKYAFVHISGNRYYKIHPRSPFAINKDYMQVIPRAELMAKSAVNVYDIIIGVFLLLVVCVGLLVAAGKLKLAEAIFATRKIGSNRIFSSSFRFQTSGSSFLGTITRQKPAGLEGGYQISSEVRAGAGANRGKFTGMNGSGGGGGGSGKSAAYEMVPLSDDDHPSSSPGPKEVPRKQPMFSTGVTGEGTANYNPMLNSADRDMDHAQQNMLQEPTVINAGSTSH